MKSPLPKRPAAVAPEVSALGTKVFCDSSFLAGQDFFAFEVSPLGDHREFLYAYGLSRLLGHGAELISIDAIVRDLVGHD